MPNLGITKTVYYQNSKSLTSVILKKAIRNSKVLRLEWDKDQFATVYVSMNFSIIQKYSDLISFSEAILRLAGFKMNGSQENIMNIVGAVVQPLRDHPSVKGVSIGFDEIYGWHIFVRLARPKHDGYANQLTEREFVIQLAKWMKNPLSADKITFLGSYPTKKILGTSEITPGMSIKRKKPEVYHTSANPQEDLLRDLGE